MNQSFESYSQNGEDVVLARALRGVAKGRYIDVGANAPVEDSVSMAFYARGWSGISIEPDPDFARAQRDTRPRDMVVEAAATGKEGGRLTLHVVDGTGLSTLVDAIASEHAGDGRAMHDSVVTTRRVDHVLAEAGWEGKDIHFMSIDTEGSERDVLEGIDLRAWRPWILVIEATAPNSTDSTRDQWEEMVIDAGYRFCLFDGLSCFYVAEEHDELRPALSYPACALDNYTTWTLRRVIEQRDSYKPLISEIVRWRSEAMTRWVTALSRERLNDDLKTEIEAIRAHENHLLHERQRLLDEVTHLHHRIDDLIRSTSWRITRPVRVTSGKLASLRRPR